MKKIFYILINRNIYSTLIIFKIKIHLKEKKNEKKIIKKKNNKIFFFFFIFSFITSVHQRCHVIISNETLSFTSVIVIKKNCALVFHYLCHSVSNFSLSSTLFLCLYSLIQTCFHLREKRRPLMQR